MLRGKIVRGIPKKGVPCFGSVVSSSVVLDDVA